MKKSTPAISKGNPKLGGGSVKGSNADRVKPKMDGTIAKRRTNP